MENAARVLLLGKTKAGKSSFINYFLGKEAAKTGAGLPITPDFKSYEVTGGKYPIHIFDSRGIEAFEASNQADQIIKELKEKNNSENIFDWFHTIFYCVSMNNRCFEDFEANFIKNLQKQLSQHIHIILTKCDGANDDQISEMRKTIEKKLGTVENVKIFEVVSVSKVKRNGTVVQPRGKEAISEQVFQLLLEDIAGKISPRYAAKLHKAYISTAKQYLDWVNEEIDKAVNLKNIIKIFYDEGIEELEMELGNTIEKLENKWQDVQKQVDREFNEIMKPISELYFSYRGIITGSFVEDANMLFDDADQ